ncbi:MAG: hypothetical protein EOO33_08040 [Comamonadaceae bacterium]|nr:MAG: hypothetical protein EOO33_08040 [Comamonadaceae bacterium]
MTAPLAPAAFHLSADAVRRRRLWLACLLLALALSYPATALLPLSVAWENGWLENTQVAVLLMGAVMAVMFARDSAFALPQGRAARGMAWALAPVWCLLAARELSWGAVLLPPVDFTQEGPVYSSSLLWYKPAVYPLAALVLAWCAWVFVRCRADRIVLPLLQSRHFVWAELAVFLLAGLLSTYAEEHLGIAVAAPLHGRTLIMEEWAEVVAYATLVLAQWQVFSLLRGAPDRV